MSDPMWCTIESDPGVFTELITSIGVKDVQVEEVYVLDDSINQLKPVYGLIFLFKWKDSTRPRKNVLTDYDPAEIFFASQVIGNACATQAILSILLNGKGIELGEELKNFKEFTQSFSPQMKGLSISNSDVIRQQHNSFARPEPLSVEKRGRETDADLFHFISYVPINGKLYELDGLQAGPIFLEDCCDENWLDTARPHIQKRMEQYASSEIRFSLMAVLQNKAKTCRQEIARHRVRLELAREKLSAKDEGDRMDTSADTAEGGADAEKDAKKRKTAEQEESVVSEEEKEAIALSLPDHEAKLKEIVNESEKEIASLTHTIAEEKDKFERWRVENTCRRHNYIPFIVNLLKILGEKGELHPLIQAAKAAEKS